MGDRNLGRQMRHHIHGIGGNHDHGIRRVSNDLRHCLTKDFGIALQ
jgi:hypothetical protein